MQVDKIRNFCIIAHIDHGKSTLADRLLEETNTLTSKQMQNQVLDDMDLEREKGITIKSHPIMIDYTTHDGVKYTLNLIDTPGHVDFTYEVSRSLAACDGALLIVDATQGVEAQTVSNALLAIEADLEIIPLVNKIDMPNSNVDSAKSQIIDLLGCSKDEIISISAKTGLGVEKVFSAIIDKVPNPRSSITDKTRALIFDSHFDQFRGVVVYVRVFDGFITKGMYAEYFQKSGKHEIIEVGVLKLNKIPTDKLVAGQVGYVVTTLKDVSEISVGDTLTVKENKAIEPLPGYKHIKPMVFSGLYPIESEDYEDLRVSLEKLKLNDSSLSYEPNTSTALGFGFRCGFLGPLHMEIVQERLEREFNMNLITTSPNVSYKVFLSDGTEIDVNNPSDMPNGDIREVHEPYIRADILIPTEYIGVIMKLCIARRGEYVSTNYMSETKAQIIFIMPLGEVIYDFFEKLKSATRGYASFDYEIVDSRASALQKLDVKISGDIVDALSIIVHKDYAYKQGSNLCKKLKKEIHRQQFEIPIQAAVGQKIIARETVKALRKNVTAKCYGGDISRKRKLLEKQKAGKKRMKQIGSVELPQEAFLAVLKIDED